MKVMILAAGAGERMRPLTDHTPKPLLSVGGRPLIEHHIVRLARAGYGELVINVSHLAQQIIDFCGDGDRWGVSIRYSPEEEPLETAGGIQRALPLLGRQPFLIVNGDIWSDYDFAQLRGYRPARGEGAHLVLVRNPPHHPEGDFLLDDEGRVRERPDGRPGLTYAGIGIYTPGFFRELDPGKLPLRPLLDHAIRESRLTGEYYPGNWEDVGTRERLQALDEAVSSRRLPLE
jgi:MurNAc alpha-1-phosphate uridylyltransferase